jgi:hypothetical protein
LPPVSTTLAVLVANAGVVGKYAIGVIDTVARWCTLTCEYLSEFLKKFEMTLKFTSGAWGKMIHEKNLKQKIS